jgi:hypothetical protein
MWNVAAYLKIRRKNHDKFRKIQSCHCSLQTRHGESHGFRVGFAALALPLIISACATEAQFLARNAP